DDACSLQTLSLFVESISKLPDNECGHCLVDFAGQLDEAGREIVLPGPPAQVEGVYRDAMAAEPGAGIKWSEAELLRRRCPKDLPNVDVHPIEQDFEFIYQRDVDAAVDVLEQFAGFGDACVGHGHDTLDHLTVQGCRRVSTRRCHATDELRDRPRAVVRV